MHFNSWWWNVLLSLQPFGLIRGNSLGLGYPIFRWIFTRQDFYEILPSQNVLKIEVPSGNGYPKFETQSLNWKEYSDFVGL